MVDFSFVIGVDEVGRGPLAGPVTACAVVYPHGLHITGLNDSKKLSPSKRSFIAQQVQHYCPVSIASVSALGVDLLGIVPATMLAMRLAIKTLQFQGEVLIDGTMVPEGIEGRAIVKGDTLEPSIMAASCVAKVYRDALMHKYSHLYPRYSLHTNMGYGTASHIEAIQKYGLSPIHRRSFHIRWIPKQYDLKKVKIEE